VGLLVAILILLLLALVVLVVSAPLRRAGEGAPPDAAEDGAGGPQPQREDLEAEREAKYREIRDAEMDFRTGKLSERDYRAVDAQLRAEALAILDRLEQLDGEGAGERAVPPA